MQSQGCLVRLFQQFESDAEAGIGLFGTGNGLKTQVHGSPLLDGFHGCGDMRQNAGLRGDGVTFDQFSQHIQQAADVFQVVRGRIHADDGVAAAVTQPVQGGGGNALDVVGGVVGLQPDGKSPRKPDGVAKTGRDVALGGHENEILRTHQLGYRGGHFRSYSWSKPGQDLRGDGVCQQPVPELADGEAADRSKGLLVVRIDDQPGHFVVLIRDDAFVEKVLQRNVRQLDLRLDPFFLVHSGHACKDVPRTQGGRLGH